MASQESIATKRVTVTLGSLKSNPFKKDIRHGKLDEEKIQKLIGSIEDNGYWDSLVCREAGGEYEIAFGHHRVEAAKRVLGDNYETSLQVIDYDDANMLRAMGAENATNETDSIEAQVDQIIVTKKFLLANPSACHSSGTGRMSGKQHEHGSDRCISSFLGETNWPFQKVASLLKLADNLHPSIFSSLKNVHATGHPEKEQETTITLTSAIALASLPQETQKEVFSEINRGGEYIPTAKIREVVDSVKPQLDYLDKLDPEDEDEKEALVDAVTKKAIKVTQAVQKDVRSDHHATKAAKKVSHPSSGRRKNKPEINEFATHAAATINKVFTEETDKRLFQWINALLEARDDIPASGRKSLVVALKNLAARARRLQEKFEQ